MIDNITKQGSFKVVVGYTEEKDGARLLDTNTAASSPAERAREMQAISDQNPRCTKPAFHASISAAPGEHLTDDQWREVGRDYLNEMGFKDNQYTITLHTDGGCEHIHIVANRVNQSDFSVVKDSNDRYRGMQAMRNIEQKYGLQEVKNGHGQSDEKGYAAGLRKDISAAAKESGGDRAKFLAGCEKRGVKPILNQSKSTRHVSGVSFQKDGGKVIAGRDLGKGYSWAGVNKKIESSQQQAPMPKAGSTTAPKTDGKPSAGGAAGKAGQDAISTIKKLGKTGGFNQLTNPMTLINKIVPKPVMAIKKLTRVMEM